MSASITIHISRPEAEELIELIEKHKSHDVLLMELAAEMRSRFGMAEREKNRSDETQERA